MKVTHYTRVTIEGLTELAEVWETVMHYLDEFQTFPKIEISPVSSMSLTGSNEWIASFTVVLSGEQE